MVDQRDKRFLINLFAQFIVVASLVHEILCPQDSTPTPIPCIVLSSLQNNVPMALIHVSPKIHNTILRVLSSIHMVHIPLYGGGGGGGAKYAAEKITRVEL